MFSTFIALFFQCVFLLYSCSCVVELRCESMSDIQRKTSPLCPFQAWQLNSMAHSTEQENCTQPNWKREKVYIFNYDYHPSKFREGPFFEQALESFEKRKKNEKRNGKRDEYVWLEKTIQIWLNPAELSTLLSTKRLPTEIHSNALHRRDVWQGILRNLGIRL